MGLRGSGVKGSEKIEGNEGAIAYCGDGKKSLRFLHSYLITKLSVDVAFSPLASFDVVITLFRLVYDFRGRVKVLQQAVHFREVCEQFHSSI